MFRSSKENKTGRPGVVVCPCQRLRHEPSILLFSGVQRVEQGEPCGFFTTSIDFRVA